MEQELKRDVLLMQAPLSDGIPTGLSYIADSLQQHGIVPDILNTYGMSENKIKMFLEDKYYDIVGISGLSVSYGFVKKTSKLIRGLLPRCRIVVGNALGTYSPEIVLESTDVDVCVIGEGEQTILDLVGDTPLESVKNICYRDNGVVCRTSREFIYDRLDRYSSAWNLFSKHEFKKYLKVFRYASVVGSRGCSYNCGFCSKICKKIYFRDIEKIKREIRWLKQYRGIRCIMFHDEMLCNRRRLYELCDMLSGFGLLWRCGTRVNIVDYELLGYMYRSGCIGVAFGVESGCQRILDTMNKQITLSQIEDAMKATQRVGMFSTVHLVFGYLGESAESIHDTVLFFKNHSGLVDRFCFHWATPLPGSELYRYCLDNGLILDETAYLERLSGFNVTSDMPVINLTRLSDDELYSRVDKARNELVLFQSSGSLLKSFIRWKYKLKVE